MIIECIALVHSNLVIKTAFSQVAILPKNDWRPRRRYVTFMVWSSMEIDLRQLFANAESYWRSQNFIATITWIAMYELLSYSFCCVYQCTFLFSGAIYFHDAAAARLSIFNSAGSFPTQWNIIYKRIHWFASEQLNDATFEDYIEKACNVLRKCHPILRVLVKDLCACVSCWKSWSDILSWYHDDGWRTTFKRCTQIDRCKGAHGSWED